MAFTIYTIQTETPWALAATFTAAQFSMDHNVSLAEIELSILGKDTINASTFYQSKVAQRAFRTFAGNTSLFGTQVSIITGKGEGSFNFMTDADTTFDDLLGVIRLRITPTFAISALWIVHGTVKLYYT